MSPILLLHVRVVILLVGPATGKVNARMKLETEIEQMIVDKLLSIVRVDASETERQGVFDLKHALDDPPLAFAQDRDPFGPCFTDIGRVERVNEWTRSRVAAMSHQVDFQKPRLFDVPVVSADGNLAFEQCARPRGAVDSLLQLALLVLEPVVDL